MKIESYDYPSLRDYLRQIETAEVEKSGTSPFFPLLIGSFMFAVFNIMGIYTIFAYPDNYFIEFILCPVSIVPLSAGIYGFQTCRKKHLRKLVKISENEYYVFYFGKKILRFNLYKVDSDEVTSFAYNMDKLEARDIETYTPTMSSKFWQLYIDKELKSNLDDFYAPLSKDQNLNKSLPIYWYFKVKKKANNDIFSYGWSDNLSIDGGRLILSNKKLLQHRYFSRFGKKSSSLLHTFKKINSRDFSIKIPESFDKACKEKGYGFSDIKCIKVVKDYEFERLSKEVSL